MGVLGALRILQTTDPPALNGLGIATSFYHCRIQRGIPRLFTDLYDVSDGPSEVTMGIELKRERARVLWRVSRGNPPMRGKIAGQRAFVSFGAHGDLLPVGHPSACMKPLVAVSAQHGQILWSLVKDVRVGAVVGLE
jgi:hypothetical protein